jgi:hypothetical protein
MTGWLLQDMRGYFDVILLRLARCGMRQEITALICVSPNTCFAQLPRLVLWEF